MATKSIIDIEISDEKFKQFYKLFETYQNKLKGMPEDWKKLDEKVGSSSAAIGAAVSILLEPLQRSADHAGEIAANLKSASKAQEQFRKSTRQSESGLKKMGHEARKVADTIFGMGKFVLKAGAWGAGLFAGGVFGLDKLANSAVGAQRSALGLGMSTGKYRAFGTDLGRYLNPSVLSSVADAQNSYAGRVWLARATGINPQQLQGMDAGDISSQLAIKAHNWWQSTPARMRTQENMQATGFAQAGLSLEDMRRLGGTPLGQLQAAQAQYRRDAGALDISKSSTNALYDFSRKLTLAGQKLESALISKLASLGPSLGNFISSLEHDAEILINQVFTKKNMDSIAQGLETFSKYLGSAEFRADMSSLASGFHQIASGVSSMLGIFGKSTDAPPPENAGVLEKSAYYAKKFKKANDNFFIHTLGDSAASAYAKIQSGDASVAGKGSIASNVLGWYAHLTGHKTDIDKIKSSPLFGQLESAKGLQPGLLSALAKNESDFNPHAVSKVGAQGMMQLMPSVSRSLGVQDPMNWIQSLMGGATLMQQLKVRYHGDLRKQIAAWNWNPTSLDKDIAAHGKDWEKYAPHETQQLISRVISTMGKKVPTVNVTITNKSGTNVAVSTNAAAL